MGLKYVKYYLLGLFAIFNYSVLFAQTKEIFPELPDTNVNELLYTFYMIGDVGDDTVNSMPVLTNLGLRLNEDEQSKSGVIFLGDNIYPEGLRKKKSKYREEDEVRINAQLDIVNDYEGEIIFIPGNHDWKRFGKGGLKAVKRQEKYVNKKLGKDVFFPENGCPGPEVIELTPGLILLIIDTQWWLHQYDRSSGNKDDCDCRNENELLVLFKDMLKKYRNQHIIVAGHHPLFSNGEHGGHFKLKDHIFPIHHTYIPLPVLGSLYPFYRKYVGHIQDLAHPVYRDMIRKFSKAMYEYDNIIYIAGHEHNLQYQFEGNIHHIISGSGSKISKLKIRDLGFGAGAKGYARILYFENGEMWLEFFVVDQESRVETLAYRTRLFKKNVVRNTKPENIVKISYKDQYAVVVPDTTYAASGIKRFFLGDLNRDLWSKPLEVPYLDIHYEKGGLTPVKKGGGQQTISLRMQGGDGKQYTLRGIKKNSMFLIEKDLRGTIAQDLIYDGMAGSHPYASVVVPKLASAAGVYHSIPKLVYVPDDPVLGDYQEEFGGMFCLFEVRPDDDMSADENFGYSSNVISYKKAIDKMQSKHNHIIDKDYILTARLFDMTIGDWDRHDDQWRWATFKENGKVYYRPIPRDRDQVFFEFDGLIMDIVNSKWLIRKFQPFENNLKDVAGTNFNARFFDRAFLIEATLDDWVEQAEKLKSKLTDSIIEEAIRSLPPEGFKISGEEIISTLKARRNTLPEFAAEYYFILAKTVSIPGTLKDDFFEIIRHNDGAVEVNIYPRKNGKKQKNAQFYHRIFKSDETKEIRLYGLDGKDEYEIKGTTKKSILVRIIGGIEKDKVKDKSKVRGIKRHTRVYDSDKHNEIERSSETKVKLLKKTKAYDYDRKDFKYNRLMPLVSTGYNKNDGFFFGPGFNYVAHGFKKEPYKFYHKLLTNRTFGLDGYNVYYDFDYIEVIRGLDLAGSVRISLPEKYRYYMSDGLGDKNEEHSILMNEYHYQLSLKISSDDQAHGLKLGMNYQNVELKEVPKELNLKIWETKAQNYLGPSFEYGFENVNSTINPDNGIRFLMQSGWNFSTNNSKVDYYSLKSEFSLFRPLNITPKQTTLALRSGFSGNFGDQAFYQRNYLDGVKNFRGFQKNMYSAEYYFFQNIDLRFSLFKVPNYIVPFDIGLLTHIDFLKSWESADIEDKWQSSYGAGIFISVLEYFMLQCTYSVSDRDELFTVGSGFLF